MADIQPAVMPKRSSVDIVNVQIWQYANVQMFLKSLLFLQPKRYVVETTLRYAE